MNRLQRIRLRLQNRWDAGRPISPVRSHDGTTVMPVTYPYGVKDSAYAAGYHTGEDHKCPVGSMAIATSPGTVVGAGWGGGSMGWGSAYGNVVVVRTASGKYDYGHCHLSSIRVREGQVVNAGDLLGRTGDTGNSTGPHDHFEARPAGGRYGNTVRPRRVKAKRR